MRQPRQNTYAVQICSLLAGVMLMGSVGLTSSPARADMSPLASLNITQTSNSPLASLNMDQPVVPQSTIQPSFGQPAVAMRDYDRNVTRDNTDYSQDGRFILASLSTATPSDRNNYTVSLFGSSERRYTDITAFTKWTGVLKRFKADFGRNLNNPQVRDWMKFIGAQKNASREDKIEAVNRYMNRVQFVDDSRNYGKSDYWATPMEFMANGGDCEDYAIAKYITLRALGFKHDEMRLAIVYDRVMRMPHALLIVYNDGVANVLDNQNPEVIDQADISRYKPIYSISQVAWWRH